MVSDWGDGLWSFNPQSTDKASMFQEQPIINPVRGLPEKVFYDIMQDDTYGYFWALSHFRLYILRVNERGELEEVKDGGLCKVISLSILIRHIVKLLKIALVAFGLELLIKDTLSALNKRGRELCYQGYE